MCLKISFIMHKDPLLIIECMINIEMAVFTLLQHLELKNISHAGTSEIQNYQVPFQGTLLNSSEVIFYSMNEETNEVNLSSKVMIETYLEET